MNDHSDVARPAAAAGHLNSAYRSRIVGFRLIYVDGKKIYASVTQAGSKPAKRKTKG
jgi:hypothetical protein